jgi:putative membrane-bound dehydrogenase-like protein
MYGNFALLFLVGSALGAVDPADPYVPRDTQAPNDRPPPAAEVAQGWKLPDGFKSTLFTSEPDVRQPIDIKLDDQGRLWVAESYSYKEWQKKGEDRILIFEDRDHDGIAETRKIFRSGFHHLSSIEIGFGGVWVLDTPNLMFIPDANQDDVPDGEPVILLDGWTTEAGHNLVNGLTWGPDGWLYGRHGITSPSRVGPPGTPGDKRVFIEPGIWRIHPVTKRFEVIVRGTTNPWGLDWDENGEMFMSNNTNGHLWHVIPGALLERMFGAGSVPYDFERLRMIGEAPHYASTGDWKSDWHDPGKGRDATNHLGGGHSHCGLMIYQADNWPERYRGHFFMNNTHGRRINEEIVLRNGATYLGRHLGDVAVANTPWFRGVSVLCGPDGGVYVSDWCDNGECHDDDGVHRSSGRIYKITFGQPKGPDLRGGLGMWSQEELAATIGHPNVWYFRHARRILQEQVQAGKPFTRAKQVHDLATTVPQKLQALWLLQTTDALTEDKLVTHLADADPHLRLWAARLLTDRGLGSTAILKRAGVEDDLLVLGHLAGLTSRWAEEDAWKLISTLAANPATEAPVIELLVWYAIEPLVGRYPDRAAALLPNLASAKVRRFTARRLASTMDQPASREAIGLLLEKPAIETIAGIADALAGRKMVPAPANWAARRDGLMANHPAAATSLGLAFGDESILEALRTRLNDPSSNSSSRNQALIGLVTAQVGDLDALVTQCFEKPELRLTAIRSCQSLKNPAISKLILTQWKSLDAEQKSAAVDVLATRVNWVTDLLEGLKSGVVSRNEISVHQARQISLIQDGPVQELLASAWGKVATTSEEKQREIERLKKLLSGSAKGDAKAGKQVFIRSCAACHTLFDEGGRLGPDLTGSGRRDPDYILLNVIDPNANIPRDYQMSMITLKDGQILAGTIPTEDEKTLTLQTITDRRILERSSCRKIERKPVSWMPEGLFQQLSEREFLDIMAYLGN